MRCSYVATTPLIACAFAVQMQVQSSNGHLQVQPQISQWPFVAMLGVVLISMLLYGHICEVHKLVVHLGNLRAVLDVAEASKAKLRHVDLQNNYKPVAPSAKAT